MKLKSLLFLCFTLFSLKNYSQDSKKDIDKKEIEAVFKSFIEAYDSKDGTTIYNLSDKETIVYYQLIYNWAINAKKDYLESPPANSCLDVLIARIKFDNSLLTISSKDYMIETFSDNIVITKEFNKEDIINTELLAFDIPDLDKNFAYMKFKNNFLLEFYRENGHWKISYVSIVNYVSSVIKKKLEEEKISKETYIDNFLKDSKTKDYLKKEIDFTEIYIPLRLRNK